MSENEDPAPAEGISGNGTTQPPRVVGIDAYLKNDKQAVSNQAWKAFKNPSNINRAIRELAVRLHDQLECASALDADEVKKTVDVLLKVKDTLLDDRENELIERAKLLKEQEKKVRKVMLEMERIRKKEEGSR